jgi:predicted PurR-regulated permease PerM
MAEDVSAPVSPRSGPMRVVAVAGEAEAHQIGDRAADPKTVCLVVLAVIAGFAVLSYAAAIILPFMAAAVLTLLLSPVRRVMTGRLRLPAALASLILVLLLFGCVTMVAYMLYLPASDWVSKVPDSIPTLQKRFSFMQQPLDALQQGAAKVQQAMEPVGNGAPAVAVQQSGGAGKIGLSILLGTKLVLGQVITVAVTLFFLLTSGDGLLRNLIEVLPRFDEKRRVVGIMQELQRNISGYLLTITAMNATVGVANGLAMWALGMPNPMLWGTLAFLLNYIPILGPLTGVVIFLFVGLFSAPTLVGAFLPAAVYLLIHIAEGEAITPMLLARRFTLNPALVIMSLFFWDWLWGVPGAFLAVPLMATMKIIFDRVPGLMPLGHLLGGSDKEMAREAAEAAARA